MGRIGWSMMFPILFMDQEEWYREGQTCRLLVEVAGFLFFLYGLNVEKRQVQNYGKITCD